MAPPTTKPPFEMTRQTMSPPSVVQVPFKGSYPMTAALLMAARPGVVTLTGASTRNTAEMPTGGRRDVDGLGLALGLALGLDDTEMVGDGDLVGVRDRMGVFVSVLESVVDPEGDVEGDTDADEVIVDDPLGGKALGDAVAEVDLVEDKVVPGTTH
jgi:hypothetical protein